VILPPLQVDSKPDGLGMEQEVRQASGKGSKARGKPNVLPVQVAIVNDYEVIVAGVSAMLAPHRARVSVVELDVDQNPEHAVDVALFDSYGQPGLGLRRLRSLAEDERVGAVAVYTWSLTETSRTAAYNAGARGLIAKALSAEELVDSLEAVAQGQVVETGGFRGGVKAQWPGSSWGLTARESEVLALVAAGLSNRAAAEALFVSENTVRTHLKAVFRKLGVTSRSQAAARALTDESFLTRPSARAALEPLQRRRAVRSSTASDEGSEKN
jgi:two-component system, NarL family, response regulator LiaR